MWLGRTAVESWIESVEAYSHQSNDGGCASGGGSAGAGAIAEE